MGLVLCCMLHAWLHAAFVSSMLQQHLVALLPGIWQGSAQKHTTLPSHALSIWPCIALQALSLRRSLWVWVLAA